jgi:hypothetical protein
MAPFSRSMMDIRRGAPTPASGGSSGKAAAAAAHGKGDGAAWRGAARARRAHA